MVNALMERHGEKMNYNDCLYLETAITKYEKHVTLKMPKKKKYWAIEALWAV